jgi:hypothetical protein
MVAAAPQHFFGNFLETKQPRQTEARHEVDGTAPSTLDTAARL